MNEWIIIRKDKVDWKGAKKKEREKEKKRARFYLHDPRLFPTMSFFEIDIHSFFIGEIFDTIQVWRISCKYSTSLEVMNWFWLKRSVSIWGGRRRRRNEVRKWKRKTDVGVEVHVFHKTQMQQIQVLESRDRTMGSLIGSRVDGSDWVRKRWVFRLRLVFGLGKKTWWVESWG